tara:strand:- start:1720 stop:3375 length:1656 start_codon:yes stop_codon:yes gene_type:complete
MAKDLIYSVEARKSLLSGSEKLAKTVSATMGPQGKNVIIGKFVGAPVATKDGVSVAREITLEDPVEDLACQLIKEAAGRTASLAGDGTTTATVLAHELFRNGSKLIDSGYSPILFRKGMNWALDKVLGSLNVMAQPIGDRETLESIASISANNDTDLGSKIAEAFYEVGAEGTVAAEASPGAKTSVRYVDGIELKAGAVSAAFLEASSGSDITLSNCAIIVSEDEISSLGGYLPILNKFSEENVPVLILAKDIKKEALATLVANNKIGRLKCVAVKMPVMGKSGHIGESEWTECLAALCGASVVGKGRVLASQSMDETVVGYAKKVVVNRFSTKIIEGNRDEGRVSSKLDLYKADLSKLITEAELNEVKRRVAFLKNKAAVITVGYSTELELREKGDRVDDAICATKAALEEGYLPGGGLALYRAAEGIDVSELEDSIVPAAMVLINSCRRPLVQILENGGINSKEVLKKISKSNSMSFGYNSALCEFQDLVKNGVIDPKKVTRTALENAVSIAMILINTEAVVSELPEKPSSWQPPAGWRPPSNTGLNHK